MTEKCRGHGRGTEEPTEPAWGGTLEMLSWEAHVWEAGLPAIKFQLQISPAV